MSDLADIAAAAGISIIDTPLTDGGDMGHSDSPKPANLASNVLPGASGDTMSLQEQESLDAIFSSRYTDGDSEYINTVQEAIFTSAPPCVEGFFGRRQRDNNRSWQRDRGRGDRYDGRGHRGRGDYHEGNRYHHGSYDRNRSRDRDRGDYYGRDRYYQDRNCR